MAKKLLTERFQELAGIRPLYELEKELLDFEGNNVYDIIHRDMMAFYKMDVSRDKIKNWADNYSWRDGEVIFDTGEREDFFQFIEDGDEYETFGDVGIGPSSLSDGYKRALQVVVGEYSTDEILTYLAVLYDQIGFYDKADMIKKLADQIQDFDSSAGINITPTDLD
jgi:hypothetical protein